MRGEGGPDVASGPAFANPPGLVEQREAAFGIDAADEVDTPGCDRQTIGQRRDLALGEAARPFGLLGALWRGRSQSGWRVAGVIPVHEAQAGARTGGDAAEELLDVAIALGFARWQEDQFDAEVQGQSHELTEDPWDFVAAVEGGVVVELQEVRNPQGFSRFPEHAAQPWPSSCRWRSSERPPGSAG